MKKAVLACFLIVFSLVGILSGCNPSAHEHTFDMETWTVEGEYHWHKATCGCDEKKDYGTHEYGDWISDSAGHQKQCSVCKALSQKEEHNFENGVCTVCKYESEAIKGVASWSEDRKYVTFGTYPQSKVSDETLIARLDGEAGLPTDAGGKWKDSGYKLTTQNETVSYMWFIDLSYEGERYRGVYFDKYRPDNFTEDYDAPAPDDGFQYAPTQLSNGYESEKVHWFKFEPIKWRVLESTSGSVFLMSEVILDSYEFNDGSEAKTVDGKQVLPNNYEYSSVRSWLNGAFYETAFDTTARTAVIQTNVNNGLNSTGDEKNDDICENTLDNVFLLSKAEIMDSSYGFTADAKSESNERVLKVTDYAKCQGVWCEILTTNDGWWRLRTPVEYNKLHDVWSVSSKGDICCMSNYNATASDNMNSVDNTGSGIVPAVRIKPSAIA